jgi:hypothetical protein
MTNREMPMPTKEQVLALMRSGNTVEAAARQLGIPAGRAYMIATGLPADYSDSLDRGDYEREGFRAGATQDLLGVPAHNPNQPDDRRDVMDWVQRRAAAELTGGGK